MLNNFLYHIHINIMGIYLTIFITKIIENALGTLRIIIVAQKKKILAAVLNGIIAFVWIASTGLVIINIKNDPYKIVFFCFGSIIGSYIGSIIEEKLTEKEKS